MPTRASTAHSPNEPDAYAAAGVDIDAGERAVELLRVSVERTRRPEVLGGLGGFAGLFRLDLTGYRRPVLATSTDGVGTKVVIAQRLDRHDTIGIDLVAMVVDDLVVVGAEPLFLTDYLATGRLVPEKVATIVAGIAEGCVRAGCALIGGETAEHPGVLAAEEYDISGSAVGVVDADGVLGPERVQPGDALIALGSSGLHSNGYSLVRSVLAGHDLAEPFGSDGRSLGAELLEPTRIYAPDCLALAAQCQARAFAHITGGGLAGNVARILPEGVSASLARDSWAPQPIFDLIARTGSISRPDMEQTFNLGVGMVAVVPPDRVEDALELLGKRGVTSWSLGAVTADSGRPAVRLTGEYQGPAADWSAPPYGANRR